MMENKNGYDIDSLGQKSILIFSNVGCSW